MRRARERGFTLVEILVVVLLIGILTMFAIPQYEKSIESSKADDAVALVRMVGNANRMYAMDNGGVYAIGDITNTCNTDTACPGTPASSACPLIACRYLTSQDWDNKGYTVRACNGATASTSCGGVSGLTSKNWVSSVKRKSGSPPGTSRYYNTWGYALNTEGSVAGVGTSVPTPTGY